MSGMSDLDEAVRLLEAAEQEMVPPDLKAKGWIYKDMPGRWTPDAWGLILAMLGDGEYQCIAMTSGTAKDGTPYRRGQFFISPQGIKNLGNKDRLAQLRAELSVFP